MLFSNHLTQRSSVAAWRKRFGEVVQCFKSFPPSSYNTNFLLGEVVQHFKNLQYKFSLTTSACDSYY